jgi:hypothetical protein
MNARRFPPPWSVEETDTCFIVRDANGQAQIDSDNCPNQRAAAHLLTRDEAGRIAADPHAAMSMARLWRDQGKRMRLASFSLRCTAGSPKGLTRAI